MVIRVADKNSWCNLQISEAFRRYGISPDVKDILVVKVCFPTDQRPEAPTADDVWTHLSDSVQGRAIPFSDAEISQTTDWVKVKKYYKLNGAPALNTKDEQAKLKESEMLILSAMALRGV